MSTSNGVRESTESAASEPARPAQLRRLRELAQLRRQTFTYPHSEAEAEVEIGRLEGRSVDSDPEAWSEELEGWVETAQVRREVAEGAGDGAAVCRSEIVGYGSGCHWRHTAR
jgi:hypothetical protein